jgi:curved DNA-binding protein CbpA
MQIPPEFAAQIEKIARALDTLDYFQILRVKADASPADIRRAYHTQARLFHPDKYHHLGQAELSAWLTAISKRVAEAYVVLRDDAKRARYTKDIGGPDRLKKLRYLEESETQEKQDKEIATTAQGKQLYHQASAAWARGDKEAALKSLKMALVYESQNAALKQKLVEWSA